VTTICSFVGKGAAGVEINRAASQIAASLIYKLYIAFPAVDRRSLRPILRSLEKLKLMSNHGNSYQLGEITFERLACAFPGMPPPLQDHVETTVAISEHCRSLVFLLPHGHDHMEQVAETLVFMQVV